METKEYILTNATQLLNRQGATNTSLRQIAAYLEMSDGNLRYHFKSKEKLVISIFQQLKEEMDVLDRPEEKIGYTSPKMAREQLRAIFYTMYRYRFLFLEASLLIKQYRSLNKTFPIMTDSRKVLLAHWLKGFKEKGYIASDNTEGHFALLLEQAFILSDNWLKYIELEKTTAASIDHRIDHYIDLCLLPLLPLNKENL